MNREGSRKRKRRVGKARSTALLQSPAGDIAVADVGILVVHGIGKQEPVETLDSLGEPVIDWLEEWVDAAAVDVRILSERGLLPGDDKHPGCQAIEVSLESPGLPRERWMLIESHWAESFDAPRYGQFLLWLSGSVPWTALWLIAGPFVRVGLAFEAAEQWWNEIGGLRSFLWMHFSHPLRLIELLAEMLGRLSAALLDIVIRLCILIVILPLAVGAAVLGAFKFVRKGAVDLLGTAGDSYAFIAFPRERDAMLSQLHADLEMLQRRCSRAVIIAHSQGAALTHQLLARQRDIRPSTFISLGAGIAPLQGLRALRSSTSKWWLLGLSMIASLFLTELILVAAMSSGVRELLSFAMAGIGYASLIVRQMVADSNVQL